MECRNCHNHTAALVFSRKGVPTYQNVPMATSAAARDVPRGDLDLYYCDSCSFLFNGSFESDLVGYGVSYENSQNFSAVFVAHVEQRMQRIRDALPLQDGKILEIGCGDGYFLRKIIDVEKRYLGFGYDKCLAGTSHDERLTLIDDYYTSDKPGDFDVIISRHVAEHIEDNNPLISMLHEKNPQASYFFETPSLEWIIENNAFYDIFYEHCSLFTRHSLAHLFQRHDIRVGRVDAVFGGQYLWLEGGAQSTESVIPKTLSHNDVAHFFDRMRGFYNRYDEMIRKDYAGKRIAIWGAGAKGVTFANLLDPDNALISSIVDMNPRKAGKFLPGSGHAIVDPDTFLADPADVLLIMNPNYEDEIKQAVGDKVKTYITM